MNTYTNNMTKTERVAYGLRELYENYGYAKYRMSKFEEYDLYVRNKSFLLSDHIITFTDIDGKLMALKPDVTLSIVKSTPDTESGMHKVYYDENVYRVPKGSFSFKEIMQTGLECIGELDAYSVYEVLMLAAKSLEEISEDFVLDISDLGILTSLIDSTSVDREGKARLFEAIGEKNTHAIDSICKEYGVDQKSRDILLSLVSIKGNCEEMLEILKDTDSKEEAEKLSEIISLLKKTFGERIRVDFSVINDTRYYNGIVFKGFIKGIPSSVLTGGRYDSLMSRMGKKSGAIGFAVYLDLVDELDDDADEFDCDVFLLYGAQTPINVVSEKIDLLLKNGKKVKSGKAIMSGVRYKELIEI